MNAALSVPRFRARCISGPMEYTSGYKYQIRKDVRFQLPQEFAGYDIATDFITLRECILTVQRGYAYNGASGTTIDTKNSMRPTAFHDAMYQLFVLELLPRELKPLVDELFGELLRADGMCSVRAFVWEKAVDNLGKRASIRNQDIKVAP